jgi:hypothetical protein
MSDTFNSEHDRVTQRLTQIGTIIPSPSKRFLTLQTLASNIDTEHYGGILSALLKWQNTLDRDSPDYRLLDEFLPLMAQRMPSLPPAF